MTADPAADGPPSAPSVPAVTVVIATRDRRRLLERLVTAVRRSEDVEVHIVVVDEASSDDTPAFLRRLGASGTVTVVRHDEPRGPSGARNAGLARVATPWVAFVDDDDLIAPALLAETIAAISATGRPGWSFTGSVLIDDDLDIIGSRQVPPSDDYHRLLLSGNKIPSTGQGLVVTTDLVRDIGGYDLDIRGAEDWDLVIRLAERVAPSPVDRPLNGYRIGHASISASAERMEIAIRKVDVKHAEARRRLGVALDEGLIEGSLTMAELGGGHRRAATTRAVRAFRSHPGLRTLARAGLVALSPTLAVRQGRRRMRQLVPAAWAAEARTWLDDLARHCAANGITWP